MKYIRPFLFALIAATFAACGSDNDDIIPDDPKPEETKYPLNITVTENPLINPDAPSHAPRRAPIITTPTLSKFYIDYLYEEGDNLETGGVSAEKTADGQWECHDGSWPNFYATIDWYAYTYKKDDTKITDDTFQKNGGDPYIQFTVSDYPSEQKDLLVATTKNTTLAATGATIHFAFDHACTALRFYVKKATNLADYTLSVTGVRLCNVIKNGDYYFNSASWTLGSQRQSYILYDGEAKTLGTTDYEALDASDAPYLFLIPQTLTAWDGKTAIASATTQTYLELDCTLTKDGSDVFSGTAYIPFAATPQQGYQHDVRINIGKNSLYRAPSTKVIP
ncbi:MAG: fimbrillin family protein [Bacteroidaceae bacterium]|nr:fimbrillin family protein [Bacteroidaceae bacterium]